MFSQRTQRTVLQHANWKYLGTDSSKVKGGREWEYLVEIGIRVDGTMTFSQTSFHHAYRSRSPRLVCIQIFEGCPRRLQSRAKLQPLSSDVRIRDPSASITVLRRLTAYFCHYWPPGLARSQTPDITVLSWEYLEFILGKSVVLQHTRCA